MSFASDVKNELISVSRESYKSGNMRDCCLHAEMYGLFLFCRNFSQSEISIKTENQNIAKLFSEFVKRITGNNALIEKSDAGKYKASVKTAQDRKKILSEFGHTGTEITRRLNRANLDDDCCMSALLRGAFMSCGTLTDPNKDYHLEFVISHKVLSEDMMKFITEVELSPKVVIRKGSYVIYFKDSESVEDLLTLMGATESSLEIMGMKMFKDMRNHVNRRMNFENANSGRAFDAAYKQIEAIRYIEEKRGLGYLPEELREVAKIRIENEDYTLKDIADNLSVPISKSGVNHRLQKILGIAEDLASFEKEALKK
ncbi:MAG: DNA-binding protein WhiA [Oscillospiraceae bacterium]|nr:DNA-binding protein WhiA [Oscillospiraceae bacterium]